jgi:hypothetical protein
MGTKIELQYLRDGTGLAKESIDFLPCIGTVIENNSLRYENDEKVEESYFVVVSVICKKTNDIFICEVLANATTKENYQNWLEDVKIDQI